MSATYAGIAATWLGFGSLLNRFAPNFHHRQVPGLWGGLGWHALWVLVLLIVLAIWCAHATARLVSVGSARRKRRAVSTLTLGAFSGLAALVLALSACVAVAVAHSSELVRITTKPTNVHGESYRVLRIERTSAKSRSALPAVAWLERKVGTSTESLRVERGVWWSSRTSDYELALARATMVPHGAVFRHGTQKVTLDVDQPKKRGFLTFLLRGLHRHPRSGGTEVDRAELEVGGKKQTVPLDPEWAGETAFLGMNEVPVVLLRVHRNRELLLAGLALLALALAFGSRKFELRLASESGR